MLTAIGLVLSTVAVLYVVVVTRRVLTWIMIAAFFAVALYPPVGWVQRRMRGGRWRPLATLVVFLVVLLTLAGVIAAFAVPVAQEAGRFAGQLPDLIEQARTGRGPIGDLLQRTNALQYVQDNQERIRAFATGLTTPVAGVLRGVATGVAGTLTVFVLAYLMVLEGPKVVDGTVNLFAPATALRIRTVGADCARSITGYISGNLMISVICGTLTFIVLKVAGVPFAALIALFVAIADLIPLVGATLGAVVAGVVAFVHSVPAGVIVVVFHPLPATGEPSAAAPDLLPHRQAQPTHGADRDPDRGGARRHPRRPARHSDRCHDPGHPPRHLEPAPRPSQEGTHAGRRTPHGDVVNRP